MLSIKNEISCSPVCVSFVTSHATEPVPQKGFPDSVSTITPILCFLHGVLSIHERSRKEHSLHEALWEVYHTAEQFRQEMAQFWRACQQQD